LKKGGLSARGSAGQSWAVAVERHSSHSAWPTLCAMPLRFWAMDQHRVHRPTTIIDRTIPTISTIPISGLTSTPHTTQLYAKRPALPDPENPHSGSASAKNLSRFMPAGRPRRSSVLRCGYRVSPSGRVGVEDHRGLNWRRRVAVDAQLLLGCGARSLQRTEAAGHRLHRWVDPIARFSVEQFHARIWPDNAMGLSRKEWLWSPNGAGVGVTSSDAGD
jgi:hypothetical protein